MKLAPIAALAALLVAGCARTVTLVHFSDYHSHAVPFYANGENDAAGIARAVAYIEPLSRRDDVLVFNGGDTINRGAPAFSDKYRCVEWPWWNGIVDAMAFGNHDADYGAAVFRDCANSAAYPILSANVLDAAGSPVFLYRGRPYAVFDVQGARIGAFALAGDDFSQLLKPETSPVDGVRFADRAETARKIVRTLRDVEKVDAVVLIGHAHNHEDEALAKAVPGIDLVLGTHSHIVADLHRIDGTSTWMIASGQYLEHLSRVDLRFRWGRLAGVTGEVVTMSRELPEDAATRERVAALQRQLEADPAFAPLFVVIGGLGAALSIDRINDENAALGGYVMDAVREAAHVDVAMSTSSSFRAALPPGPVRETDLRDALPYDNAIHWFEIEGADLARVLDYAISLRGTDSFVQLSGAILGKTGAESLIGGTPIEMNRRYTMATTDYVTQVSLYKGRFGKVMFVQIGRGPRDALKVRDVVRDRLATGR
ncbi:MAG: 5'-nucleotidase C-terminal domain-containing protein [Thermoanaerobaculia bacterium]|jgi:5'-nucleotidase